MVGFGDESVAHLLNREMQLFIILILICGIRELQPLILEDTNINQLCTVRVGKKKLVVLDKLWTISNEKSHFYMNFCDHLHGTPCPDDAVACITSKVENQKYSYVFTKNITMISKNEISLESSNYCQDEYKKMVKLYIKFDCLDNLIETPELTQRNSCEYEVKMATPQNWLCTYPQCTMNYVGHLLDLRPLKGVYFVRSSSANFSIALCQTNTNCRETNVTACKLSSSGRGLPEALATESKELMTFHSYDNEVHIRSSYGGSKEFEIIAKCNWDKTIPDIQYIEPSIQGRRYRFSMETSHACIKVPPKCVIPDEGDSDMFYDLTKLYKETGYWYVGNNPKSRILLNICGPLKMDPIRNNNKNNNCSKTYSQVCQIDPNENYINLGSIQNKFSIQNNVLSTEFVDGVTCQEDTSKKYNTNIEFKCSKIEEGPKFLYSANCITYLVWNTPQACPQLSKNTSCHTASNEMPVCSLSFGGHLYDLSQLAVEKYYTIPDSNASIEYMLNVCQPVMDSLDVPCTSTSMVLVKYVDEVNRKKKIISLGRMVNISVIEDNIAIRTAYGSYCEKHYYSSIIYFSCSDKDEPPHLLNKTDCHYNFMFKTKAACPNLQELAGKCEFRHPLHKDTKFELQKLRNPFIKVSISGSAYIFDICSGKKQLCLPYEHCIYGAIKKQLYIFQSMVYLDFVLDKTCDSDKDFNRSLVQLECDAIQNNDNYKIIGTKGCILYMKLSTNLACLEKNSVIPLFNLPNVSKNYFAISEQMNISTQTTVITNPYTGYSLDLADYSIPLKNILNRKVEYLYSDNSTVVDYETNISCTEGEFNTYRFHIDMICVKEAHKINHLAYQELHCLTNYTLKRPEVCKLLELNTPLPKSNAGMAAYTITAILAVIILGFLGFMAYRKWPQRRGLPYIKEGDL